MVLPKIVEDEAEETVVVPLWTTQSWWLHLAHLIVDFPIKLPSTRKVLYQPNNPERPQSLQKLILIAFCLSGKFCKLSNSGRVCRSHHSRMEASTKKQYKGYLRKWLKFLGSRKIDPLKM